MTATLQHTASQADDLPQGYKRTEVGVIPVEWEVKNFGETAQIRKNKVNPKEQGVQPFCIELEHIASETGLLLGSTEATQSSSIKTLFFKDDILFGKLRAYLKKYWFADRMGVASTEIWAIVANKEKMIAKYLFQIVRTDRFIEAASLSYGTHMPRSDWNIIKNLLIPLPPLPEQTAIATILSDMDGLIAALTALIAKKRAVKHATMQQLLTGKTRLAGFTGAWEVKRLGEVANIRSGGTPSTNQPEFWDGDILWCTPTDITALNGKKYITQTARKITEKGLQLSAAELLPPLSIIMTSRATIGECALNLFPISTNQGFKNFIPCSGVDVEFLYYFLQEQKQAFVALCSGSTFLEISKTQLAYFQIPLPPLPEQTAIATILSDMDAEITTLETRLAKTKALKTGMCQDLLTGKIRLL